MTKSLKHKKEDMHLYVLYAFQMLQQVQFSSSLFQQYPNLIVKQEYVELLSKHSKWALSKEHQGKAKVLALGSQFWAF